MVLLRFRADDGCFERLDLDKIQGTHAIPLKYFKLEVTFGSGPKVGKSIPW